MKEESAQVRADLANRPTSAPVQKRQAEEADAKETPITPGPRSIHGRILDPQGTPVPQARIWLQRVFAGALTDERLRREEKTGAEIGWNEWIPVTTTNPQGEFRFDVDNVKFSRLKDSSPRLVAATADGLGFGFSQFPSVAAGKTEWAKVTIQMAEGLPIEGRILTVEGQPAAGASIQVIFVRPPNYPLLDDYIADVRAGGRQFAQFDRRSVLAPGLPQVGVVDPYGRQPNAVTDRDGRFTLNGIGAERIVHLFVWGPSIELKDIVVVTRPSPDRTPDAKSAGVLRLARSANESREPAAGIGKAAMAMPDHDHYYAQFTHASGPVRVLKGVVRDHETGKPVAGVQVSWEGYDCVTSADGRYELTAFPKQERYQIRVNTTSGKYFNMALPVADTHGTGPIESSIDLPKGITARGRVTIKQTGQPFDGVVEYNPLFPNPYLNQLGINHQSTIPVLPRSTSLIAKDGTYSLQVLPGPGVISVREKDDNRYALPRNEVYASARIDVNHLNEILGVKPAQVRNTENELQFDCGTGPFGRGRSGFKALAMIRPEEGTPSVAQDLIVNRGHDIRGSVLGPDGKPIRDVMVTGLAVDPVRHTFLHDHTFTVNCLSPDETRVLVFTHRKLGLSARVEVRSEFQGDLTVQLEKSKP